MTHGIDYEPDLWPDAMVRGLVAELARHHRDVDGPEISDVDLARYTATVRFRTGQRFSVEIQPTRRPAHVINHHERRYTVPLPYHGIVMVATERSPDTVTGHMWALRFLPAQGLDLRATIAYTGS